MVGNIPNFTAVDVLRLFLKLNKKISRAGLVTELGLGEGTVRGIFNILKERKLIGSTAQGHFLTEQGRQLYNRIGELIEIKRAVSGRLYPKYKKVCIRVKNPENAKADYQLRDVAVKCGAEGAIIFRFGNGRLNLPQLKAKRFADFDSLFNYGEGDIMIVAFAESYYKAENGALAVAMHLSRQGMIKNKMLKMENPLAGFDDKK